MKRTILFALSLILGISAWAYENTSATFKWAVGNEAEATITSDAADGVKEAKVKIGAGLTVGTRSNLAANNGVTMVTLTPTTSKPGKVESAMVEYSVKMKKGITFTLTGLSYEAIKQGTDNASYSWSYTVDGVESTITDVSKDNLVRDNNTTGTPALLHSETITADAGRTVTVRFYVSGFDSGKLLCLSNIQLEGKVNGKEEVRAFKDFKIEFRDNPYSVILPEDGVLPTGVEVTVSAYNGGQHGIQGGTIVVPVDGPVKFTFGACQYSKTDITIKKDGADYATVSNAGPCGEQKPNYEQFVTWTYNVEESATLTFELGSQTYLPYFFAEACEFVPQVEVRYYDTDGKTLIGSEIVDGGSALAYKYGAADVTVADGYAFRGWFNAAIPTATKVAEGLSLTEDLKLYAKATEIEVTGFGKIFDYDFRQNYFYPEDHELLSLTGGKYNDAQHGWAFSNNNTLGIQVAGNALLAVDVCKYSATGTVEVKDAEGNKVGELSVVKDETADGSKQTIYYEGPATTLTFYFTATNYIHHIKVYNIAALPEKNEELGYYILSPGDGAGLKLVLESLQAGDKIFLPNGVYDFGADVLTQISKSNVSLIGQSMEGTIIRNAPDFHNEGIATTATFFIPSGVNGTYFQDLTIQNAMDYYAAIASGLPGGRGVCLQDKGNQTVCKNVRFLSYQDTYYSNYAGSKSYFEDCEIHGTVDFICGSGSVYFKNNLLFCEKRNLNGGGSDCITAHTGQDSRGDKGFVFEGCTLKSACPIVSLGRAWGDQARTYFLNTLVDYSEGNFAFTDSKGEIKRWTLTGINTNPTEFGEFNTHLADGTVLTPASNEVTFNKGGNVTLETVLSAERAAELTINYTLGDWTNTALNDAKQAVAEKTAEEFEPNGIYLVEADGEFEAIIKGSEFMSRFAIYDGVNYTVRKANARGGFGKIAGQEQAIDDVESNESIRTEKKIINGQLIIIRDGKMYNALGAQL